MQDKAADVHRETVCLRFIKTGCAAQRSAAVCMVDGVVVMG